MAFTTDVTRQVVIEDDGVIFVRRRKRVLEDGELASDRVYVETLVPGADVSGQPARVQSLCALVWTPAVISAYQAKLASALAAVTGAA